MSLGCSSSEGYFEGLVAQEIPAVLQWISKSLLFWQIHMSLMQSFLKWKDYFSSITSQMLMHQVL